MGSEIPLYLVVSLLPAVPQCLPLIRRFSYCLHPLRRNNEIPFVDRLRCLCTGLARNAIGTKFIKRLEVPSVLNRPNYLPPILPFLPYPNNPDTQFPSKDR